MAKSEEQIIAKLEEAFETFGGNAKVPASKAVT